MKRSDKFEKAIQYILVNEGDKYTDDPTDRGGATKYGITLRTAQDYPGNKDWTKEDIKNLSEDGAKDIYWQFFWKFENINDLRVATKLLDVFVNLPPASAIRVFQSTANSCGARLVVDGLWGSRTATAINACDPECFLTKIVVLLHQYYSTIVKNNPPQAKFLKGWLRRADRLPEE